MITDYIKNLIDVNKDAVGSIENLEKITASIKIENDKDKANFGNMCIILHAYRMIADASEAMLINENVLKDDDGNFYQKIEDDIIPTSTNNTQGSDYDLDKNKSAK